MKDFILVCPKTAVAYNEVFKLFKNATAFFGYSRPFFKGLQGLCRWLTTYYVEKPLIAATGHANERYDNYPAINADRVKDIPRDYYDNVGTSIYILNYDMSEWDIVDKLTSPVLEGKKIYKRIIVLRKKNDK